MVSMVKVVSISIPVEQIVAMTAILPLSFSVVYQRLSPEQCERLALSMPSSCTLWTTVGRALIMPFIYLVGIPRGIGLWCSELGRFDELLFREMRSIDE